MRKTDPFLLGFSQGILSGVLIAILAAALVLRIAGLHVNFY